MLSRQEETIRSQEHMHKTVQTDIHIHLINIKIKCLPPMYLYVYTYMCSKCYVNPLTIKHIFYWNAYTPNFDVESGRSTSAPRIYNLCLIIMNKAILE